ncbi:hypothetical protein SLE2022_383420 [Rubroshorea leprosula]
MKNIRTYAIVLVGLSVRVFNWKFFLGLSFSSSPSALLLLNPKEEEDLVSSITAFLRLSLLSLLSLNLLLFLLVRLREPPYQLSRCRLDEEEEGTEQRE